MERFRDLRHDIVEYKDVIYKVYVKDKCIYYFIVANRFTIPNIVNYNILLHIIIIL